MISGEKNKSSYCSKPVPSTNPVLELLKPEVDDLSVEEISTPALSDLSLKL